MSGFLPVEELSPTGNLSERWSEDVFSGLLRFCKFVGLTCLFILTTLFYLLFLVVEEK